MIIGVSELQKNISIFKNLSQTVQVVDKKTKEVLAIILPRQKAEKSSLTESLGGILSSRKPVNNHHNIDKMIDLAKQAQVIHKKNNKKWMIVKSGKRISHIEIEATDGSRRSLQDEKEYKVLSNSYLVNNAGNGYYWFNQYGKNQKNSYTTFYTVMVDYVEKNKIMNPKPKDGRLKVLHQQGTHIFQKPYSGS